VFRTLDLAFPHLRGAGPGGFAVKLKLWGVRGSTPTPERRNSRYGGNTPCLEVRLDNGTLFIFDCGSGMRPLGKSLMREFDRKPILAYVFLSHVHWDHIQGLPFFLPLYKKGNAFLFHCAPRKGGGLEQAIEGQMSSPYFPVDMGIMGAVRRFYDIGKKALNINGATITPAALNHPQGCVGYRIEADGGSLVYATDTEPGSRVHDKNVRKLAAGTDLLIYDSQYTEQQLKGPKKGWGHSSWIEGVKIAKDAGCRRLMLFHHDPDNDDTAVDQLLAAAKKEFPHSLAAAEGQVFEIRGGTVRAVVSEPHKRRHR
jgi:phosphoribosyl 1,2-cyclic phosphodiesterase